MRTMRTLLATSLILAGLATLTQADLQTGTTLGYPIVAVLASDPVMLQGETQEVSFGNVAVNQTYLSNNTQGQPRSTVKNIGYETIDYTVAARISTPWSLGTVRGANVAVLYGVFTRALRADEVVAPEVGRTLVAGDFDPTDILLTGGKNANDTQVAVNADPNNLELKGNNVSTTNSTRSVRYRLDTPTSNTAAAGTKLIITVTIGAGVMN